jgi:hypothetical protein
MAMKVHVVFWDGTPRFSVGYRRFGEPCCIHLRGEDEGSITTLTTSLLGVANQKTATGIVLKFGSSLMYIKEYEARTGGIRNTLKILLTRLGWQKLLGIHTHK